MLSFEIAKMVQESRIAIVRGQCVTIGGFKLIGICGARFHGQSESAL